MNKKSLKFFFLIIAVVFFSVLAKNVFALAIRAYIEVNDGYQLNQENKVKWFFGINNQDDFVIRKYRTNDKETNLLNFNNKTGITTFLSKVGQVKINSRLIINSSTLQNELKLDVKGDVSWSGILQDGKVSWKSLINFPTHCEDEVVCGAANACE